MATIQGPLRVPFLGCVLACLTTLHGVASAADFRRADICVYGGTSAGVVAAVAASNAGKAVILIEPTRHLGGMSSGGLGQTDFGNKQVIGGLSREFYRKVGKFYGQAEGWQFHPHHAEQVFREWAAEKKIPVIYEHRLSGVEKTGRRIVRIILENAPPEASGAPAAAAVAGEPLIVEAAMFIDATYEGDLMARAKVTYTVGREAVREYGESLNGIRAQTPKHQFLVRVDPYMKPGDPSSGLLPFIQEGDGGTPGDGDRRAQTYNFRLCLTRDPANRLAIKPPADYDAKQYELLARYLEALVAAGKTPALNELLSIIILPGGKTDINNNGAVSTDFIGRNYKYPEGDYATRSLIWKEHLKYTQGLLYFLATSERVPASVRQEMQAWGLCKDEFIDTAGWPNQIYVREARRLIGRYVITQADCEHSRVADDSIGMGAYNMDSHNYQRIVKNGAAENEGDVQVGPRGPYPISYRAITPKPEECENLLVPVCLSATHIAYGSIRMEPVFMVLGESAAMAACQSLEESKSVQEIDFPKLRKRLLDAGQVLRYQKQ
jgi:ribulose 1,5-bisphosphate synthetase/thiazole synthase